MESPERTTEEAYNDLKCVTLALRNIVKFLNGKDAVKVRLLDSYWDPVVTDTLRHEERIGMTATGVKVNLTEMERLNFFLDEFPEAIASTGLNQFSNFHLCPQAPTTAMPSLRFGTIHGPSLRFATIYIPATWHSEFEFLKVFLNRCPTIEKLGFKGIVNEAVLVAETGTDLRTFPNLVELEIHRIWDQEFYKFLKEFLLKAPKLHWISMTIDMWGRPQELAPYLGPFQHLTFVGLDLRYSTGAIFRELAEMDIEVIRTLIFQHSGGDVTPSNEEVVAFNDWLGRQVTLQSLTFQRDIWWEGSFTLPFRLPSVTSIRELDLEYSMDSPIRPTQVPDLEKVILTCVPIGNPLDPETEFGKVKWLTLYLHYTHPGGWIFQFPNLVTLNVAVSAGTLEMLRGYLGQFPNIVKLILEFGMNAYKLNQRNSWWDYFTGRIRPIMRWSTGVEDLLSRIPPISDQELLPLQLLPGLKSLELRNTPEIVAFAVINLTAIGRIPNLDDLGMALDEGTCEAEVRNFMDMLKQHHRAVWITRFIPQPLDP